jgi:Fe-S-cluster containining protein
MTTAGPVATGSALCVSCGLCCDGTLFSYVPVRPVDRLAPLTAGGIQITTVDAKRAFALPCVALHDRRCAVYQERPTACRRFRCKTLVSFEAGDVSWDEARARITRTEMIRTEVRTELARLVPAPRMAPIQTLLPDKAALEADVALRQLWAPVLVRVVALATFVRKHFVESGPSIDSPVAPTPPDA